MAHARPTHALSVRPMPWLVAVSCVALLVILHRSAAADEAQWNRIRIEYVAPKIPAYKPIHDLLKERQTLEKVQEIISPFNLRDRLVRS